jgi:GNAT superfamily N-acetyltransferase
VYGSRLLVAPPSSELGGLVVASRFRGQGAGRAVLERAEAWSRRRGYARLRVRSNVVREGAHRFYEAIGYATAKTSRVFEKALGGK